MSYPRVEISLDKIKYNTWFVLDNCSKEGIKVVGVTKVFCGHPIITRAIVKEGIETVGDSRIQNLKKAKDINAHKLLLRLPMLSETEDVVEFADISLNSEYETIRGLSDAAGKKKKIHKIILMMDLGDLREGIFKEENMMDMVKKILKLDNVQLIGLGTNLTCFGGIEPDFENLSRLTSMRERIKHEIGVELEILSGGASGSIPLIFEGEMPKGINQLRVGSAIVNGNGRVGTQLKGTYNDCFVLKVEIVEIKEKPSIPVGNIGLDAFGNNPKFVDRGIRKRAICAIGKQDIGLNYLVPINSDIIILGGSSDHLILDITDCKEEYKIGDKVSFKLKYGGILNVMTSEYVSKVFL